MEPVFFATADDFRAWLAEHHESASQLLVGFHKKGSGRRSMTWSEAVDQALCFGWIDGVRRSLDADRYVIRFTPRKPGSTWSAANIKRAQELIDAGLMRPAGLAAFQARTADRSAVYSYERRRPAELAPEHEERLRADPSAWEFFAAQPPSYRRTVIHWVESAKREGTRLRRLAALIEESAAGRRLAQFSGNGTRRRRAADDGHGSA